ncbi:MAG: peptidoglycan DD-metalloendopeptidase family protein [Anaerolineales bacterium]|nr:peptidoglycan DD-metalloendopeptidase family protein [Chloroflexota bacterium]MBL6980809.1 peptidoglycan DD-metalloendopeptidase family protein [Anaerolineales bacterium]
MSIDPLTDSPFVEEPIEKPEIQSDETPALEPSDDSTNPFEQFLEQIAHAGLVEPALRVGTLLFSLVLVLVFVWVMRTFYLDAAIENLPEEGLDALAAPMLTATPDGRVSGMPNMAASGNTNVHGVIRKAGLHTTIPTRPRVNVIAYTVQAGDSVFGIAENFGLKPETILWSNSNTLQDNPHRLQAGQELNIMPIDGTYHKWSQGENFEKVAEYYGVDPMTILEWPGNLFNIYEVRLDNLNIEPGTLLIIPGGQRDLINYGPPRIPRDNPAVARTYGPGHCGTLSEGIVGDGLFIWPANEHWLSGYDYSPGANHPAIDIAGDTGDPVYASDDGVVVYSGWSYSGYGNLVVIDHGNGWQSLYAHLDTYYVECGLSIFQGAVIGTIGNTGNSAGDHLHFELVYETAKVNPWNFLP